MEKGQGEGINTLQTDNVFTRKEYIEREAVREMIAGFPCTMSVCLTVEECKGMRRAKEIILKQIERIPAADVVPVVRCGECKHRDPEDRKCDCGWLEHAHMFPVSGDWFCADGEKREAEHD